MTFEVVCNRGKTEKGCEAKSFTRQLSKVPQNNAVVAEHSNTSGAFENEQKCSLKRGLWMLVENFYCLLAVFVKSQRWGTGRGVTVHSWAHWEKKK